MAIEAKHMDQLRQFAPDHYQLVKEMERQEQKAEPTTVPAEFTIDLANIAERLTVEDVEDVEDASGLGVQQLFAGLQQGKIKGLAALVWVLRRKDDRTFTLAKARAWPLRQLVSIITASAPEAETVPLDNDESKSA